MKIIIIIVVLINQHWKERCEEMCHEFATKFSGYTTSKFRSIYFELLTILSTMMELQNDNIELVDKNGEYLESSNSFGKEFKRQLKYITDQTMMSVSHTSRIESSG